MPFCSRWCVSHQYCQRLVTPIFTDEDLKRREFQADFKAFLVRYTFQHHICAGEWHDHLTELYRDYRGWIRGEDGRETYLDMSVFEVPHIREWFRDYIQIVPDGRATRLRGESKERVRVFATIMRAHFPFEGSHWGMRAANDNDPTPLDPGSCPGV